MEKLSELVQLWKRGTGPYSRGFLAFTICHNLGRLHRVVDAAKLTGEIRRAKRSSMAGAIPSMIREIRVGEELLFSDPRLARTALAAMDSGYVLGRIQEFTIESWIANQFSGEDLGDDAILALYTLDLHLLVTKEASRALTPTAVASRKKLRIIRHALRSASRLVRQHPEGFLLWQRDLRAYCEDWAVGSDNPLYAIGFPSWKALRRWKSLEALIRA